MVHHVEVTCRNCGTTKVRNLDVPPVTPFVSFCPDCSGSSPSRNKYTISVTLSGTEEQDGEEVEVELTRLGASFEHASIAGALADGTLADALAPMWQRLQKHADLIEG